MSTATLNAVMDDELATLLQNLGVYNDFQAGLLKCKFSEDVITWDNLHSIFPQSGAIKFCCNKATCIEDLADLMRGSNTDG